MKHALTGYLAAALVLSGCSSAPAPEDAPRAEVNGDWAQVPDGTAWGEVSAVDTDSHGHIFVLQRAGRVWEEPFPSDPIAEPVVFMFARDGKLLASWGAGETVMPHGLSVDEADKVWITDVQREQVLRFSHDGEREMAIGKRGGSDDLPGHFGRPADIAFSGDKVFVADGYANSRIAVFDRQGNFVRQWGREGSGAEGLAIPHSVAVNNGKVYVADRENARIKIFGEDGELIDTFDTPGHPYAVKPLRNGYFLSVEGRDRADRAGAIIRVWRPGGTIERVLDARGEGPTKGHDLAIGADGTIYLADPEGSRVLTFELAQNTEDE
ncbi:peptidyl-alpha-hydroxyglycine alpha-amidating lyase family protein [Qipengyuania qiaonensis]|uniref:Peptidyl-alpha-hydroxyglycine alpha-amidating lyase family protein n=1 Tax=Qipengyuania qiaonensis TaxID=2867240 RepID=A0ABS7J955_9SPHN|nr:peptidyl-alpha-hydroxyglycine alpha-amidating lyase family protein [Qipengyuania qiaonensis]MBX7482599.1 peptidyl-alpha-hydroxyglycine alpha-amidating lyase family protein [Qipengyuania qiaonensis]